MDCMSDAMVAMSDGMVDGLGTGKCDQGSKNEALEIVIINEYLSRLSGGCSLTRMLTV